MKYELSYEDCYPNTNKTYRILEVEEQSTGKYHKDFIYNVHHELKNKFPQIVAATSAYHEKLFFQPLEEKHKEGIRVDYVKASTDYLKIFAFNYIEGSPQSVAENFGTIITKEIAQKFFGKDSAVGRRIYFSDQLTLTIDAVVELPQNTDITFDILDLSREDVKGKHYIMLGENNQLTDKLEAQIEQFLSSIRDTKNTLRLQAIKDIHLHSPVEIKVGSIEQIIIFSIAVCLILIIAIVSNVNSSIARAMNRIKEIGIRKVNGAKQYQLIARFLCEHAIISALAIIIGLLITMFLFPYFSQILSKPLVLELDFLAIMILIVVWMIVTFLSGGYAAFYLSSLSPIKSLRGGSNTGSKESFRKILLGVQFFISISILLCTVCIYKQLNMMLTAETGVSKDNILVIESNLWYNSQVFFDEIKKKP